MNKNTQNKTNSYLAAELKVSYGSKKPVAVNLADIDMAARYLRQIWETPMMNAQEYFYVIFLDTVNNVIGWRLLGIGTHNSTQVDVKLICSIAAQTMSSRVIVAHNHPSGSLQPSRGDISVTWRIQQALNLFDVILLDHIILTEHFYYSFVDHGKLKNMFNEVMNYEVMESMRS